MILCQARAWNGIIGGLVLPSKLKLYEGAQSTKKHVCVCNFAHGRPGAYPPSASTQLLVVGRRYTWCTNSRLL